jgi:CheY-like chemotaxis protein
MIYRILLIDDDKEMNDRLVGLLSGHRIHAGDMTVSFAVEVVQVGVMSDQPGYWRFDENTIDSLKLVSTRSYDLIMADYGLVDDAAKDILWGKDRSRCPTRQEAKGRLLTLQDLSQQYAAKVGAKWPNIFLSARQVHLRSFASRLAFDLAGPVYPERENVTKAAFPNAKVRSFDPRNEIYGGDAYYAFYDQVDGREFYRQLVGHHILSVAERYVLRALLAQAGRLRVRRSVFNIAVFAGCITIMGGATQYLATIGLNGDQESGWLYLALGFVVLVVGALLLSMYFEAFSRQVIRWVGSESDFDKR